MESPSRLKRPLSAYSSPSRSPSIKVYNSPSRGHLHSSYETRLRSPHSATRHSRDTLPPSPMKTPERVIYSDRHIPSRAGSYLEDGLAIMQEGPRFAHDVNKSDNSNNSINTTGAPGTGGGAGGSSSLFSAILRTELLGPLSPGPMFGQNDPATVCPNPDGPGHESKGYGPAASWGGIGGSLLRYKVSGSFEGLPPGGSSGVEESYSLSPISRSSERFINSPRAVTRKIAKVPFKVLDAPALQDDFYLNLVDWSSSNVLAVGLASSVYLWSAFTSKVTKLCDLGSDDLVTAVSWNERGNTLSVGTNNGCVEQWDVPRGRRIRTMEGHTARVGTISWSHSSDLLASGSRDRSICVRDPRAPDPVLGRLHGHKQEVCGLRWSFDDVQLASGGNDNKLYVWDVRASVLERSLAEERGGNSSPVVARFSDHTAAVKAIAWSPHQHGLLASGGGTADRCIRFWNTQTSTRLHVVDTGSQICNLMWSKNVNELVSTHGYSLNQVIVWRYPSMTKVATLTGHTYRVLYLAMSPDGQTIVTGAGDETLRFWNVFPSPKNKGGARAGASSGFMLPGGMDIR